MALLKNKTYIKINLDGSYKIYKNKYARDKEKKITAADIKKAYMKKINSFSITSEALYYNKGFYQDYVNWKDEYNLYCLAYRNNDTTYNFPLMATIYKNVKDSIPVIIEQGKLGIPKFNTLTEVYEYIKKIEVFGKIDELEDI